VVPYGVDQAEKSSWGQTL